MYYDLKCFKTPQQIHIANLFDTNYLLVHYDHTIKTVPWYIVCHGTQYTMVQICMGTEQGSRASLL